MMPIGGSGYGSTLGRQVRRETHAVPSSDAHNEVKVEDAEWS